MILLSEEQRVCGYHSSKSGTATMWEPCHLPMCGSISVRELSFVCKCGLMLGPFAHGSSTQSTAFSSRAARKLNR